MRDRVAPYDIIVYSDASVDKSVSGIGFAIRAYGRVYLEAARGDADATAQSAEKSAAVLALKKALTLAPVGSSIILKTDLNLLAHYDKCSDHVAEGYRQSLEPIFARAAEANLDIAIQHVRGHGGG